MRKLFFVICGASFFLHSISVCSLESYMTHIYRRGLWGHNAQGEGNSGLSSTYKNAKPYIDFLQEFLEKYQIQSVVDAGCGDWEFSQHIDWSGIDYTGIDIVKFVIEKNITKFARENIRFIHGNFAEADLPAADLLICKDVFQIIDFQIAQQLIAQMHKYKYCLFVNNPAFVRMLEPPFNLNGTKIFSWSIRNTYWMEVFLITIMNMRTD